LALQYSPTVLFLVHSLLLFLRQSHYEFATERILVIRSGQGSVGFRPSRQSREWFWCYPQVHLPPNLEQVLLADQRLRGRFAAGNPVRDHNSRNFTRTLCERQGFLASTSFQDLASRSNLTDHSTASNDTPQPSDAISLTSQLGQTRKWPCTRRMSVPPLKSGHRAAVGVADLMIGISVDPDQLRLFYRHRSSRSPL
jgi:hypothetical protein